MDNKVMHKRQLVDEAARRTGPRGLTRRQVREVLHGILDVTTDQMAERNAITIAGFGRFEAKEHKGRRVVGLGGEEHEEETRVPATAIVPMWITGCYCKRRLVGSELVH